MAEVLAYAIGLAIAVGSRKFKHTVPSHTYGVTAFHHCKSWPIYGLHYAVPPVFFHGP